MCINCLTLLDSQKWSVHAVGVRRTGLTNRGDQHTELMVELDFPHIPVVLAAGCGELPAYTDPSILRLPKPFTR